MGRVVKAASTPHNLVRAQVVDAHAQAKRIVQAAHRKAEAIIADAEAHTGALVARALEQARREAREELAGEHLRLAAARAAATSEAEHDLATLALAASKQLLGRELTLQPEAIGDIVRPLLAKMRHARSMTLRVHPEDAHALSQWIETHLGSTDALEVTPAEELTRGSVWIHSELGEIDAKVETRLAALAQAWDVHPDD